MDSADAKDASFEALRFLQEETRRRIEEVSAENDALRRSLGGLVRRLYALEAKAKETAETVEELEEAADGVSSVEAAGSGAAEEGDAGMEEAGALFAYEVRVAEQKVFVLLPNDNAPPSSGGGAADALSGPFGTVNVGSSKQPKGTWDAQTGPFGPWQAYPENCESGTAPLAGHMDWAKFSWYEAGTLSDGVDHVVYGTWKVPLPKGPRNGCSESGSTATADAGDEVTEGGYLSSVSLATMDAWRALCEQSWKEKDDPAATEITRRIPIAHVTNGIVVQMLFGPPQVSFGSGDGAAKDIPDAEAEKNPATCESFCQKSVQYHRSPRIYQTYEETIPGSNPPQKRKVVLYERADEHGEGAGTGTDDPSDAVQDPDGIVQLHDFDKTPGAPIEVPVVSSTSGTENQALMASGPVVGIRTKSMPLGSAGMASPSVSAVTPPSASRISTTSVKGSRMVESSGETRMV